MASKHAAQSDGRKGILVRVPADMWRRLKDEAARETIRTGTQVSLQSLIQGLIARRIGCQ